MAKNVKKKPRLIRVALWVGHDNVSYLISDKRLPFGDGCFMPEKCCEISDDAGKMLTGGGIPKNTQVRIIVTTPYTTNLAPIRRRK